MNHLKEWSFKKGMIPWNKGKKGVQKPYLRTEALKRLLSKGKIGEKNPNWNGGTSGREKSIKNSSAWRVWRTAVFERDDFTCQVCGERGGKLHPHHIKPFAFFEELRFDIANGQTLCHACHRKTDNYGANGYRLVKKYPVNSVELPTAI